MLGNRVTERSGRPVALANSGDDILDQVVLSENQNVDVEYRARLVGQPALHAVGAGPQLLLRFPHGAPEVCFFLHRIVRDTVGHRIEIGEWRGKDDGADRHPRSARQALDSPTGPDGPGSCGGTALPCAA